MTDLSRRSLLLASVALPLAAVVPASSALERFEASYMARPRMPTLHAAGFGELMAEEISDLYGKGARCWASYTSGLHDLLKRAEDGP